MESYQFVRKSSRDSTCLIRVKSDSTVHIMKAAYGERELRPALDRRYKIDCLQNLVSCTGLHLDNNQYTEGLRKKITRERFERIIILLRKNYREIIKTWEIVTVLISFSRKQIQIV